MTQSAESAIQRGWRVASLALAGSVAIAMGCADPYDPNEIVSVSVSPGDTAFFAGDTASFEIVVQLRSGVGLPDTVEWSASDSSVLDIVEALDGVAVVEGRARGAAYLIGVVNGAFTDSALVSVVEPGQVRWRAPIEGDYRPTAPALDGQWRIYVSSRSPGWLTAVSGLGERVYGVPGCWSALSPAVLPDGTVYTASFDCTARHSPDGTVEWSVPYGNFDAGLAVASDGSVVFVHIVSEGLSTTVVSRLSADGAELWQDTLAVTTAINYQASAPAIAANGDIYVAWSENELADRDSLSRLSADGSVLWTVPGTGWMYAASPALWQDRVVITGRGGNLAVHDTSGALLWRRTWNASVAGVSSPVVDPEGNVYVQSEYGLNSYAASGDLRWSADSLGCARCGYSVGAPTLLSNGQLLAPCMAGVCAVDASDGSLVWHTSTTSVVRGSPAVAPDGTIYVSAGGELIALWGKAPPLTGGWPTEGGCMGRLRRVGCSP